MEIPQVVSRKIGNVDTLFIAKTKIDPTFPYISFHLSKRGILDFIVTTFLFAKNTRHIWRSGYRTFFQFPLFLQPTQEIY